MAEDDDDSLETPHLPPAFLQPCSNMRIFCCVRGRCDRVPDDANPNVVILLWAYQPG
ncbi:hypothetical protein RIB2604_00901210 [Aspergillus luchuensis]|uniref:Uncharacterized protein n=1 Tax=Aspergillus kawachii TaxID=1069201 RepID=A0A146F4K9_ASPKA|nr:hypothetical protein RIB2604_00901210 [Aspergillus luchuensis]